MKVQFRCGCGFINHDWEDWISHFKYGLNGKWHAFKLLMKTEIKIVRN